MMWGVITPEAIDAARTYWRQQNLRQRARRAGLAVEPRKRGRPPKVWPAEPPQVVVAPALQVAPNPWVTGPNAAAKLTGTK
jgi:hypothetical protein